MYVCAVANQKGGVGKTTTTQNLGTILARHHKKNVLMVDLDAQGNLTDACDLEPAGLDQTIYQVLSGDAGIEETLHHLEPRLDLLPANINLSVAELAFAGRMGRENLFRKAIAGVASQYDYILVDCPPSLGLLTVNALAAAAGLLVPVQVEYHALAGLALIRQTVDMVRENLNSSLEITGLVLTFFDSRKRLNRDVAGVLEKEWGELVFRTRIRDNVSLAEAPSDGKDILTYRKNSMGAEDYAALAKEFCKRTRRK